MVFNRLKQTNHSQAVTRHTLPSRTPSRAPNNVFRDSFASESFCSKDIHCTLTEMSMMQEKLNEESRGFSIVEVKAPPGRLGLEISTAVGPIPVIHGVKPSSVLKRRIKPLDLLLAIDDEDITKMSAFEIMKMMKLKSFRNRNLTLLRLKAYV